MLRLTHTDLFKQQVSYLPYPKGKYHILSLKSLGCKVQAGVSLTKPSTKCWHYARCFSLRAFHLDHQTHLLHLVLRVISVLPRAQQILKGILDLLGKTVILQEKKNGLDNKFISIYAEAYIYYHSIMLLFR